MTSIFSFTSLGTFTLLYTCVPRKMSKFKKTKNKIEKQSERINRRQKKRLLKQISSPTSLCFNCFQIKKVLILPEAKAITTTCRTRPYTKERATSLYLFINANLIDSMGTSRKFLALPSYHTANEHIERAELPFSRGKVLSKNKPFMKMPQHRSSMGVALFGL